MRERPILFSGEMVRAILDGRKTMTRRVIKPQPKRKVHHAVTLHEMIDEVELWQDDGPPLHIFSCPFGQAGDALWVRETWRVGAWREDDGEIAVDFKADGFCDKVWRMVQESDADMFDRLWEESCKEARKVFGEQERYKWAPGDSPCRWRSPLFMPRWASRLTLEITGVRVERLQDITEEDAYAEGRPLTETCDPVTRPGAAWFRALWHSLHAKDGYGWDANPWVWVIAFRRKP